MLDFRQQDIRVLWRSYQNDPPVKQHGRENGVLIPMLQRIKKVHGAVAHCFGAGGSTRLQFEDSKIAEQLMLTARSDGVPVLPVHDSFIVPITYASYFEQQMRGIFDAFFDALIRVKQSTTVTVGIHAEPALMRSTSDPEK